MPFQPERVESEQVHSSTGAHVLLAEDQPEMRKLMCRALSARGFRVEMVEDGHALVRTLIDGLLDREAPAMPDLIVSDVRMPGCSGIEMLRRLRRFGHATNVILVTAFGDRELHEEAERLGGVRVLDKPFDLDVLCDEAQKLVSRD